MGRRPAHRRLPRQVQILGENLSLAHQYAYTSAHWARMGYGGKAPAADWTKVSSTLPRRQVTWFQRGDYDRLLVSVRDGNRLISLPVINGGESQHMHNPYFPIPFSPGMLSGSPDGVSAVPHAAPDARRRLDPDAAGLFQGTPRLRPTAPGPTVSLASKDELDRMGERAPVAGQARLGQGRLTSWSLAAIFPH
ncbi:hypothetical protein ACRAWD_13895 [Caulobacter segnis]